ncbi:hypothetical protein [Sphingobium aromaticivastans]
MLVRPRKSISGICTTVILRPARPYRAAVMQHLQIGATFPRRDLMHSVT